MAAKTTGLGDGFLVNGYDLSGNVSSLDKISAPITLIDVTTLNRFAHERIAALRDGAMSFTTQFLRTNLGVTVTTPGVPASGTPLVSTYTWPVYVTITGGTMSAVVINGATVGSGAGNYVIPAQGTITLTYTVAPTWAWSFTPPVPASTVAFQNIFNWDVAVTITGGTMSNVVINGVSVGTGAGTYILPQQQYITLTYSAAPTWVWNTLGAEHDVLKALYAIAPAVVPATYLRGQLLGNPAACISARQTDYDPTRANEGSITFKVDLIGNQFGLEWGVQVTNGQRTDVAATIGTFFDQGAPVTTIFGCQAYLQLLGFIGTSVDVSITHCATSGGTYTSLVDFGAQNAVGGFRQAMVGSVNEFVKVVTTGTFTYARFNVVLVRNQVQVNF
jgi:hypothetical protein